MSYKDDRYREIVENLNRQDDPPATIDAVGTTGGKASVTVYRGVAPTTNRGSSTDYHGDPISTTGTVAGERSVAVYLTPTELLTVRMALEKWTPYSEKRRVYRDALLLTFARLTGDDTPSKP